MSRSEGPLARVAAVAVLPFPEDVSPTIDDSSAGDQYVDRHGARLGGATSPEEPMVVCLEFVESDNWRSCCCPH